MNVMLRRMVFLGLLLGSLVSLGSGQDNWSRWRVETRTEESVQQLADSDLTIYPCTLVLGSNDVAIGPGEMFKLVALGLPHQFVEVLPAADAWANVPSSDNFNYRTDYGTLADIQGAWDSLVARYPQIITRTQIATTFQGRPVYAYRFRGPMNATSKQSVLMIGGIHAREWISPAVMLHLGHRLADRILNDAVFAERTRRTAIHIAPMMNPDGYSFTWTTNRLWRKNRRDNGNGTFGVDLNRNYSVGWGGSGSSSNTSSDIYRGPSAFSEPETAGLRDYALAQPGLLGFIDFHNYSQVVIHPWGNTTAPCPDHDRLVNLTNSMVTYMESLGSANYQAGQASILLYVASGCSDDYMYGTRGAMSMTIELRDTGQFGFQLPASEITPTQNEAWNAFERFYQVLAPGF